MGSVDSVVSFVLDMKGKVIRMFTKESNGEYPEFVYINNAYVLGNEVLLNVTDYEAIDDNDGFFRIVRLSDIETFEYFASDSKEGD